METAVLKKPATRAKTKTFLHVGCGKKSKEDTTQGFNSKGWKEIRLDIAPSVEPDIIDDIRDMKNVKSASVDAVFSSHNIEHLYSHEVQLALKEFWRVLKPEGFLVITCPDLQSVCELVAKDRLTLPAYKTASGLSVTPLDIMYGWGKCLKEGKHYMAHKTGFTKTSLMAALKEAGFPKFAAYRRMFPYFDIWACASKVNMPDDAIITLGRQHFPS